MKWIILSLVLAFSVGGCDYYRKPHTPIPESFRAKTLEGQVVDRAYLEGKPWVISIWVPGCGICAREAPALERIRKRYEEKGVGFLALSLVTDPSSVSTAAKKLGIGATVAMAEDETLGPLAVNQVPSTVFVSSEGLIVAAASGERGEAFLEKRTRELLER